MFAEDEQRGYPYATVPAILLGRMAVHRDYQNQKIGGLLLIDALGRSALLSRKIGPTGVVVDSKSDRAKNFYLKYGFTAFARKETSLFKPMQDIGQMFESGDTAPAAANDETHIDRRRPHTSTHRETLTVLFAAAAGGLGINSNVIRSSADIILCTSSPGPGPQSPFSVSQTVRLRFAVPEGCILNSARQCYCNRGRTTSISTLRCSFDAVMSEITAECAQNLLLGAGSHALNLDRTSPIFLGIAERQDTA